MLVLQLALRNIWRQRRRNAMVLLAIVLTITGVFVMNALARGMEHDLLATSIENLRGHIKILAPQQRDVPGFKHLIAGDTISRGLDDARITAVSPRVRVPVVIQSERETRGVELVGIDPRQETHSLVPKLQIEGQPLVESDDGFLLLGREFAEDLKTKVGRRVVVIMMGPDEKSIEVGYRVQGIFDSTTSAHEKAFAFTGLSALQDLAGTSDLTEISVYVHREEDMTSIQADLQAVLGDLLVLTWTELDPFIGEMYQYIGFSIYILIAVFMSTLVFGLINALVTAVLERAREFGLLRAVGMRSNAVVLQVVIECVVLMVLGLVVGVGIGLLMHLWLADGIDLSAFAAGTEAFGMSTRMVPRLHMGDFLILVSASVLLGLIASYFPARRIIKTSILDSIRAT